MKNYRIAVSLTASTVSRMWMDGLTALRQGANMLELRLDYLKADQFNEDSFEILLKNGFPNTPLILTNRHKDEANPNDPSQGFKCVSGDYGNQRIALLQRAVNLRAQNPFTIDYIDIERRHFHELDLNPSKTKLIVSSHDFIGTPKYEKLIDEYKLIANMAPDIVKIATIVNSSKDARNILRLIRNYHNQIPLIAIGMGEIGVETRIKGPELGAYLTYACSNSGRKASPGQISVSNLYKEWGISRHDG